MSATSRFGWSLVAAAVLTGIPLGIVEHKPPARLAAAAASQHVPLGHLVGWAFAGLTIAAGLVLFVLSSLASRGRGESQGNRGSGYYPARPGRRAGRR